MAAKPAVTEKLLERLRATVAELEDLKRLAIAESRGGLAGNIDMALSYLRPSVQHLASKAGRS
jgi:hypothetical protein